MRLEVYQTDGEVYEAAAALAAGQLVAAAQAGLASLAVPGGRGGRALLVALAARADVPWRRVEVFFTDETCPPAADGHRSLHVARESLLSPRGVPPQRVHPIDVDSGGAAAAVAYEAELARVLGTPPVLDVILLELGAEGEVAGIAPESAAATAAGAVAVTPAALTRVEPRADRVTLTAGVLATARQVVVTVTGAGKGAVLAAALREPLDLRRRPAQAVLPSARAAWFVDRAAAEPLLRDARPADQ
jgi:6-phosphogluconolactonase